MKFYAHHEGVCANCGGRVAPGAEVSWTKGQHDKVWHHPLCPDEVEPPRIGDEPQPEGSEVGKASRRKAEQRKAREDADAQQRIKELERQLAEANARTADRIETVVRVGGGGAGQAGEREIRGAHPMLPRLLSLVARRLHVYVWGPPQGGKSTAAHQVAELLGLPFGYVSLNPQTPESRLIGYKDAMGRYCTTPFRELYEHGGVFCIDEMDNAHPALLTTINSTLANGIGAFPDALVQRHKDFILVCTGNTAGRGGDLSFPERRAFDAAFMERFAFLRWPYDAALEWRLTMAANLDTSTAERWLAWVRAVRAFCTAEFPRLHVTPTAAFRGAELLQLVGQPDQGGWTLDDVAESVLFRGIDSETRAKVLGACPLSL